MCAIRAGPEPHENLLRPRPDDVLLAAPPVDPKLPLAGKWPWWDPSAAAGQVTFPDALNQFFLPPVVLLRVLFPAVVGFNLIVVAPFPWRHSAAWLFLRRYFSPASATLGAVVFAGSGAVISTEQFSKSIVVGRVDSVVALGGGSRPSRSITSKLRATDRTRGLSDVVG